MTRTASFRSRIPELSWRLAILLFLTGAQLAHCRSDPPLHYYDSAIGKTGAALKAALHDIIKAHAVLPYTSSGTDTWTALKALDEDPPKTRAAQTVPLNFRFQTAKPIPALAVPDAARAKANSSQTDTDYFFLSSGFSSIFRNHTGWPSA